tara:strand:- start:246 stop:641 length:396 start_codon:yes stop_codon:yes gene_type:complete
VKRSVTKSDSLPLLGVFREVENMNCPEQMVLNTRAILIYMIGDADIPRRCVPLKWWLNPLRYEITVRPRGWMQYSKSITFNRSKKWHTAVTNFAYVHINPKLCRWLGIHQRYKFRGGEKQCHHCETGRNHA